jgi:membrane peptidoglycan carboxypeptidase
MNIELEGYVVYCKNNNKSLPYGVVSKDFECQASSDYIPSRLKEYLILFEDKRFFKHNGIDYKGVARASIKNLRAGKIVQGGSTITQQLARNILRDNRKSFLRKVKETIKAVELENTFNKDEILNLYFNNIYFGKNLRGIRSAGLHFFGKEVDTLNQAELLYLLTILRGPNYYIKNPSKTLGRFKFLSQTLYNRDLISKSRHQKNITSKIVLQENKLHIIKNQTINFITDRIDIKSKKIISTIDIQTQQFARQFVSQSKYPISIVAVKDSRVTAFASSYGTDYPFVLKSNVGSTLKPFLYCFLREQGISNEEKFISYKNDLDWKVREVSYQKPLLSIDEALFHSNNNAFINASHKIGIDQSLVFLSNLLKLNIEDLYPSSILGATKSGISLFDLAYAYSIFFDFKNLTSIKRDCLTILNEIAKCKLNLNVDNVFLKTGTTNNNKERLAVIQRANTTFAILRNDSLHDDYSKEGSFIIYLKKSIRLLDEILKPNRNYKW